MGGEADGLWVDVLGTLRARRDGRDLPLGAPRQRAVLAVLAARVNRPVGLAELIDALWTGRPPPSAVNNVHVYVAGLRRVLDPGRGRRAAGTVLLSDPSGYLLRLESGQLDVDRYRAGLSRAHRLAEAGDLERALDAYDATLALWRGTPFADVPGPFLDAERAQLTELRLAALEDRAGVLLGMGIPERAVAELSGLVVEQPLREPSRALLMTALVRAGRSAEALTVYADTRKLLIEELGTEPGQVLQRLHRAILNEEPVAAPYRSRSTGGVVPRQVPPAMRHFVGRRAELDALTRLADEATGPTVVICAIDGAPGVGKSTVAVHWAHQVADRFPDGQLYVNLRGFDPSGRVVGPDEAVCGFLDALGVAPDRVPVGLAAQTAQYRSLLAGRRVLVILDNARDAEQVRPLLPGTPGCLVLVTSRHRLTALIATEGAHPLTLALLTVPDARELLGRHLGTARVAAEPAAVDEIVVRCARLPLALSIAGARAAGRSDITLGTLARQLGEGRPDLDALDAGEPAADVRAVFSWSYRILRQPTARLFRLLSLHPGPDIGVAAAASLAGLPRPEVESLLAELAAAHLVEESTAGRYALHDLLRAYAAELLGGPASADDEAAARTRLLDHYLHSAYAADRLLHGHRDAIELSPPQPGVTPERPAGAEEAQEWFTAERAALVGLVAEAYRAGLDAHAWQLAWCLTTVLDRRGRWLDWVTTQSTAVAASRRTGDRPGQARAHRALGLAYARLGRDSDAHAELYRAAELFEAVDDHVGQARANLDHCWVFERDGDHRAALEHAERALDRFAVAGHRAGQANALNAVGWYHTLLGEHRAALGYCERALALHQEIGHRPGEAATWDSLGYAYHRLGDQGRAIDCYRPALGLYEQAGDQYLRGMVLVHLGDALAADGQPEAAVREWRRALAVFDELGRSESAEVRARLSSGGTAAGAS